MAGSIFQTSSGLLNLVCVFTLLFVVVVPVCDVKLISVHLVCAAAAVSLLSYSCCPGMLFICLFVYLFTCLFVVAQVYSVLRRNGDYLDVAMTVVWSPASQRCDHFHTR